jgi:alpha-galactosidase
VHRHWAILVSLIIGASAAAGCGAVESTPDWGPPPQLTPPMGWNSWNSGIALTEQSVEDTIDAMVRSGMRDAGYRYVNLDAGWSAAARDRAGNLRADPDRFPHGIAAVARYAHNRGMVLGLYASPNYEICGQGPANASAGHETADARRFAAWGVDYLKYDWCSSNTNHADQVRLFTAMRDALRATGRRIIYSINPTTSVDPSAGSAYDWSGIADMTRNSIDLVPVWRNTTGPQGFLGVADQLAAAIPVAARSRPGHWNDPDMLVVGISWAEFVAGHPGMVAGLAMSGTLTPDQFEQAQLGRPPSPQLVSLVAAQRPSLSAVEQRAHFSLWAMLAAPLLAGNDVRSMPEQTRAVLANREVIAVDQDALVIQGKPLADDTRIVVKPLIDGSVAVALFNPDPQMAAVHTSTAAIGLKSAPCYAVRDLWAHTDSTTGGDITGADIPAHGVALLRVTAGCRLSGYSPCPSNSTLRTEGRLTDTCCLSLVGGSLCSAVLAWACAVDPAEGAGEVGLVGKAPAVGDGGDGVDGMCGVREVAGGPGEALGAQPVGEGDARAGQDQVGVALGDAVFAGEATDVEVGIAEMHLEVFDHSHAQGCVQWFAGPGLVAGGGGE